MTFKVDRMTAICCDSVRGQLSDGKWENSPRMERYWRFFDVDVEHGIIQTADEDGVCESEYRWYHGSNRRQLVWKENGFRGKTEKEIRVFFANKIREIVKDFCDYHYMTMKEEWNKDNATECPYLTRYIDHEKVVVTIGDAYKASKSLRQEG